MPAAASAARVSLRRRWARSALAAGAFVLPAIGTAA